jgi:hypothetical protein
MIIRQYLMKAIQDDAKRAGERDRLLLEARRARTTHRQRACPAAPAKRIAAPAKRIAAPAKLIARLLFRRATAQALATGSHRNRESST